MPKKIEYDPYVKNLMIQILEYKNKIKELKQMIKNFNEEKKNKIDCDFCDYKNGRLIIKFD